MENDRYTEAMKIAVRIARLADDLKWCSFERYAADGHAVIKGQNELVSLYAMTMPEDAQEIAAGLELVIAPVRRRRIEALMAQLATELAALSKTDY